MHKTLKFSLNPGVTLHVGESEVVLHFNFKKHGFRKYIRAKTKTLPEESKKGGIVDATAQGLPLPRWLLRYLISTLKQRAVGAVEDEDPSS